MALVLAPWTIRNYLLLGGLVPLTTNVGVNLYIGNNPNARPDGGGMELERSELPYGSNEIANSRAEMRRAFSYMLERPFLTSRSPALQSFPKLGF